MKRIIIAITCIVGLFSTNSFAQNEYNHWSLNLKAGMNKPQFIRYESDDINVGFTFGAEIERTFNPLWGLALEYDYIDYSGLNFDGTSNQISLLGTVNISNLLAKYRQGCWQKFNVYGRLGIGAASYNADESDWTTVIPAELALEYNVSKRLAIGLTGEHRWLTSTSMGITGGLGERAVIWSFLGNVRVKLGSREYSHIRNVSLADYESEFVQQPVNNTAQLVKKIQEHDNAIKNMQEEIKTIQQTPAPDFDKLNKDIQEIKEMINGLKKSNATGTTSNQISFSQNVEFPLNSTTVPDSYKADLDVLAQELSQQKDMKIEIIGHTDNIGSKKGNQALSLKRAKTVANYLISKGVDAKQITTLGMGDKKPIADNDTVEGRRQNRRVEFIISK